MRIQALILLIPFSVFLIETASFLPAMEDACTIVSAEENSCCMMNGGQDEEQCSGKTEENKETGNKDCTDNPDCTSCPVCYTFIFQPQYEWYAQQFLFTKHYRLVTASYSSSYTVNVWKPPNPLRA
jgi:hypothetical protein